MGSVLYRGLVVHHRKRPKQHRLRYRVFWLLLDLDEVGDLDQRLRLFSHNRFNLLSFHDADHGDGSGGAVRRQVEGWLARAGISIGDGAIRLLTMPRVLGYVFNPISLYYCHRPDGGLAAMVYEVTSTFGVRHAYVIPVDVLDQAEGLIRQTTAKALYVSPFMGMDMDYVFRGNTPGQRLDLTINGMDAEGLLISATMAAQRQPLTDRTLWAAIWALPLMTLKVTGAIHWEALKLWLKGIQLTRQPPPAPEPFTIQNRAREGRLR
jgi:DUF1365 family protein